MGVDEAAVGHRRFQLPAQLADVHVDRAVARAQLAAPHRAIELLPAHDRAHPLRHRGQQLELAHRQRQRLSRRQHQTLAEANLQFARIQHLGAVPEGRHERHSARRPIPRSCELVIER